MVSDFSIDKTHNNNIQNYSTIFYISYQTLKVHLIEIMYACIIYNFKIIYIFSNTFSFIFIIFFNQFIVLKTIFINFGFNLK